MRLPVFALLLLATALPAAAAPSVTLVHEARLGRVLAVQESTLTEADLDVHLPDGMGGRTKAKWRLLERKARVFKQEIVEVTPEGNRTLALKFSAATKEQLRGDSKDRKKQFTTLHQRHVWASFQKHTLVRLEPSPPPSAGGGGALVAPVAPGAGAIATVPISDEDKGEILFAERLYGTFPEGELKVGQIWDLDPKVAGYALFGHIFNPAMHAAEGKCQYKGVVTSDGVKCARILMRLKGNGGIGDLSQGIKVELAPQGYLHVALDGGWIVNYHLTGPIQIAAGQMATRIEASGKGKQVMQYRARRTKKGKVPDAEK